MNDQMLVALLGAIGGVYILLQTWLMWKAFDRIDEKFKKERRR